MALVDMLELHAREKAGMTADWKAFSFESFPKYGREKALYFQVTGAVAPLKTKGDAKGRPNWRKLDKSTERVVVLLCPEHDAWASEWEIRTGGCANCNSTGKTVQSWSAANGTVWKQCPKCEGTGKHK